MYGTSTLLTLATQWNDSATELVWKLPINWTFLAEQFNQDILGDIQKAFNHFVQSGQVWALLIGIVLGYMFRALTSY